MGKMYYENLYSSFDDFKYIVGENSCAIWKVTDLTKLPSLIQTEFFQLLSKFCTYFMWDEKLVWTYCRDKF